MNRLLFISSLLIILTSFASYASTANNCKHPVIEKPDKWVPSQNCTSGHTYKETTPERYRCSCWGHCGYICRKIKPTVTTASPTTKRTRRSTRATKATTTKVTTAIVGKTKCPFGSPWIPPNDPTQRCVCKGFNHKPYYSCKPVGTTSSTATTITAATTATAVTTVGTTTAGTTTTGTTTATAGTTTTLLTTTAATTTTTAPVGRKR